jgi:hypothetical protein
VSEYRITPIALRCLCVLASTSLLSLLFNVVSPPLAFSQEEAPDVERSHPETTVEGKKEIDRMNGITPEEREAINDWRMRNPGTTDEDYREAVRLSEQRKKGEEGAWNSGVEWLRPRAASGWGIVKYTYVGSTNPKFQLGRRFEPVLAGSGDKFVVLTAPLAASIMPSEPPPEIRGKNFIWMSSANDPGDSDITRFFEVNNSFLRDVPFDHKAATAHTSTTAPASRAATKPKQSGRDRNPPSSKILVITGARVGNRKEIVTVFEMGESVEKGGLRGRMFTLPHGLSILGLETMLIGSKAARVYYYGDELRQVDLSKICARNGSEFIRRSPGMPRNLMETNRRLRQIADRPLDRDKVTVIDGLPQDSQAVQAMGLFAGDSDDWLEFHEKVTGALQSTGARHVTAREEFIRELAEGDSDLLILIAHSEGSELYLNGTKMSLQEIQALPRRQVGSVRPRLAVLISCDAGKAPDVGSNSWWRYWIAKQGIPLAQVLVDKGFVDKVIAPDHKITADESLTVLRRALSGASGQTLFENWINWAVRRLRYSVPVG